MGEEMEAQGPKSFGVELPPDTMSSVLPKGLPLGSLREPAVSVRLRWGLRLPSVDPEGGPPAGPRERSRAQRAPSLRLTAGQEPRGALPRWGHPHAHFLFRVAVAAQG